MTDLLAKAAKVLEARTKGPWNAHANHKLHQAPVVDCGRGTYVCACATASDQSGVRDAVAIALLGTCADEFLAVARAAQEMIRWYEPDQRGPSGDALAEAQQALAALDRRLAEYFGAAGGGT